MVLSLRERLAERHGKVSDAQFLDSLGEFPIPAHIADAMNAGGQSMVLADEVFDANRSRIEEMIDDADYMPSDAIAESLAEDYGTLPQDVLDYLHDAIQSYREV
jgi:hypothetical protein